MSDNRLERMRELVSYLNKASHAYYVMDDPVISDMQYCHIKPDDGRAQHPYPLKM